MIGCYNAITRDADAIAFLDADCWYYPDHLRSLTAIALDTKIDEVASARILHRPDGSAMMGGGGGGGGGYIDLSCLLVMRPAFQHLIAWVLQTPDRATRPINTLRSTFRGFRRADSVRRSSDRHARQTRIVNITKWRGRAPPPDFSLRFRALRPDPASRGQPNALGLGHQPRPGETASQPVPGPAVSRPFPAQGGPSTWPGDVKRGRSKPSPATGLRSSTAR